MGYFGIFKDLWLQEGEFYQWGGGVVAAAARERIQHFSFYTNINTVRGT